jgi:hypothetical protein
VSVLRARATLVALGVVSLASLALTATSAPLPAGATEPSGAAAAAPTGTVVLVKDHNVFIVRADGTGLRQVTRDGTFEWPYVSPSMADDGTIAVARRNEIIRMRQGGTVLNRMDPRPLPNAAGVPTDGTPAQVAISPDGSTIAYTFAQRSCPEGLPCEVRTATGYTAAARLTDPAGPRTTYFKLPTWVGDARTLQSGGSGFEVMVHDLGRSPVHWFDSDSGLADLELSPDGTRLAGAAGFEGDAGVSTYDVRGDATSGPVPEAPSLQCTFVDDAGPLTGPTWGPDSRALAFEASDGVYVAADVAACAASPVRLLVRGGATPDWSRAAYRPESPTSQARPFRVVTPPRVVGRPRVGQRLVVRPGRVQPSPTSVRYQWRLGGRAVRGAVRSSYRVRRADRRGVLSVAVTLRRSGFVTTTRVVTVGRVR